MVTKRNVDLITEAFSDVMTARRKYELKKPNGELLKELYFPPLTRHDRIQAQNSIWYFLRYAIIAHFVLGASRNWK